VFIYTWHTYTSDNTGGLSRFPKDQAPQSQTAPSLLRVFAPTPGSLSLLTLSLPDIHPTHSPREAKRRKPSYRRHVEHTVGTLAHRLDHALQTGVVDGRQRLVGCAGVDDLGGVDGGGVHGEEGAEPVGENALGAGQEDGAAHSVAEKHEGCADGGVACVEAVLQG